MSFSVVDSFVIKYICLVAMETNFNTLHIDVDYLTDLPAYEYLISLWSPYATNNHFHTWFWHSALIVQALCSQFCLNKFVQLSEYVYVGMEIDCLCRKHKQIEHHAHKITLISCIFRLFLVKNVSKWILNG